MELILFLIIIIVYLIWSIIGLIVWIPLLFRTIAVYSFSIAYTTMANAPPQYIKKNERNVKKAVAFYYEGFLTINHLWQNRNKEEIKEFEDIEKDEELYQIDSEKQWTKFGIEAVWAIIFWTLLLLTIIL